MEVEIYQSVQSGDVEKIKKQLEIANIGGLRVGVMSHNELRQAKYAAVATVAILTRVSIYGGLLASEAYRMSDNFIQEIDNMDTVTDVLNRTMDLTIKFTQKVKESQNHYSANVRRAMEFVTSNLKRKITLVDVSDNVGISPEYLSTIFKNEAGENLSHYIIRKKLEYARFQIESGGYRSSLAYELGFSSQSYFIDCFKKEYGITPKKYMEKK